MIYDFTERKQQNECVVNRLSAYREKYNAPRMSRWQVKKLRDGMEQEIKRQRRAGFVRRISKVTATAAALAAAFSGKKAKLKQGTDRTDHLKQIQSILSPGVQLYP